MFKKDSDAHCRFCGASLAPEEVYRLEVPFFERTYELCRPCRDAWESGCRSLNRFEPRFRPVQADGTDHRGAPAYRWPRPLADDALFLLRAIVAELPPAVGEIADAQKALLAREPKKAFALSQATLEKGGELELALGLAAGVLLGQELGPLDQLSRLVDRRSRSERTPLLLGVYAHAVAGKERGHLEVARTAYLLHLSYTIKDELDGRIASLHVLASLDLNDEDGAGAKLRQYRRQADTTPAARDPRIPLLQAKLYLSEDNLAAADGALETALAWSKAAPTKWADLEALVWFDTYVRAIDSERWEVAKDALKSYCKLRPDDRCALHDLGHAFMKCAADPIAREVLASYHAHDPKDKEGVLLYATCLARLDDTRAAWTLLRDDLESESDDDLVTTEAKKLGAERRHLAALVAEREGHSDRALELMASAYALAPEDDEARENFVTLLLGEVRRRVDDLTPETLSELAELLSAHTKLLEAEYGSVGLAILRGFVSREIRDDFKTAPSFGMDRFEKLRFGDADLTSLQAYELIAQRKLGDAVRKDRQAQQGGGRAIPMELVLRFLDKVRRWPEETRKSLAG